MDAARNGNFTSSELGALMSNGKKAGEPGKPFFTYIAEKNMERRLGRALENDTNAKPMNWGKVAEKRVFNILGTTYQESSVETIKHPRYDFWMGSPDGQKFDEGGTVLEIKCPFTLKSFCQFIDATQGLDGADAINSIRENHADGDKYYWQIVSNSILLGTKYAELCIYCPYEAELDDVKAEASNMPVADLDKYYGLANSPNKDLPYLIEGKFYKNLNIIRWEVKQADRDLLTSRVLEAAKLLIQI